MDNKDLIIETMTKQNADLTALVQTLTKSNVDLTETIKELQETIRELQRQLSQNSQNSSKPPSSDGFNKPKPQSLRQKSGKKQGGQKGHPGAYMSIPHEPDEYRKHLPEKCLACPHLKERSLIERLMALKASVCLFIRNFDVPFDNNQAERDVRNVKTKTKVSGCFRTGNGAQNYLDIMSYISTGRKHGLSAYEALTAAFAGNAEIVLR